MNKFLKNSSFASVSQLVSSITNTFVILFASRNLSSDEFGLLAFVLSFYTFGLTFLYSFVTEPWLRSRSSIDKPAVSVCVKAAFVIGLILSILLVLAICALNVHFKWPFYILAAALPILLMHEALRVVSVSVGRARIALYLDIGWLVGTLVLLALAIYGEAVLTVTVCLSVWAGGALIGLAVVCKKTPDCLRCERAVFGFLTKDVGSKTLLSADGILMAGAAQVVILVLAAGPGLAFVGLVRLIEMCFAPAGMSVSIVRLVGQPRFAKYGLTSSEVLLREVLLFSLASVAITISNGIFWVLVSDEFKGLLLGERWVDLSLVLMAGTWYMVARLCGSASQIAARVVGKPGRVLSLRLFNTVVVFIFLLFAGQFEFDPKELLVILGLAYFIGSMAWILYILKISIWQENNVEIPNM